MEQRRFNVFCWRWIDFCFNDVCLLSSYIGIPCSLNGGQGNTDSYDPSGFSLETFETFAIPPLHKWPSGELTSHTRLFIYDYIGYRTIKSQQAARLDLLTLNAERVWSFIQIRNVLTARRSRSSIRHIYQLTGYVLNWTSGYHKTPVGVDRQSSLSILATEKKNRCNYLKAEEDDFT